MTNIPEKTTTKSLVLEYYRTRGVTSKTTTTEWLFGLAAKKYLPYTAVLKQIQKERNNARKNTTRNI